MLASCFALVIAAAFAGPAQADLLTTSTVATPPGLDHQGVGVPAWYQDRNNLQIEPCDDGTLNCFGVTAAAFIANNPNTQEIFYNRGVAKVRNPLNAGELLEQTVALQIGHNGGGFPFTFQRIRTRVVGGAPNATYSVTEPFGTQTVNTDAIGGGTTTQDIGCPFAGLAACDFSLALAHGAATAAGSVGPLITWDAGAPLGYVGDARTAHTAVVGATPAVFTISGGDLPVGGVTQNLYVVTGKLAPDIAGAPVTYARQLVGTASAAQNVTVINQSPNPITIATVAVAGTNAADFAKTAAGDLCTGKALASGATCTVGVTFTPTAAGARTAVLAFTDNGTPPSTNNVILNGAGAVPPAAPTADVAPGTYASAQSVTLSDAVAGAVIHYTLDGSTPTPASPAASGPISVTSSQTINAIAVDGTANGAPNASTVASFAYVISPPPPPAQAAGASPTSSPAPAPATGPVAASTVQDAVSKATAKKSKHHKKRKHHAKPKHHRSKHASKRSHKGNHRKG